MLETSRKKIKNFVNLLRKKLVNDGCSRRYVAILTDSQVLEDFRLCHDCGEEIYTKDQQTHIILEFDTPERAYEILHVEGDFRQEEDDSELDFNGTNTGSNRSH